MEKKLFDELSPVQAERIWRQNAQKKLERALQNVANVSSFFAPKTKAWKMQDEAYTLLQQVHSDLIDLNR